MPKDPNNPKESTPLRITLKDIAQHTGYSVNTVSRALRGVYPSEESTKKIFAAAEELGYIGNSIASSMRLGETRTIAVILGDIANPHYARIVKTMANYLSKCAYTLTIYNTENSMEYEKNAIISSIRHGVDGVLICPIETSERNVEILKKHHMPFVIFGRGDRDPSVTTVRLDDVRGGYIAAKHLIDLGCENIVFINGPEQLVTSQERLLGFMRAFSRVGKTVDPKNIVHLPSLNMLTGPNNRNWKNMIGKLLEEVPFDGIVAFSDQVALKALYVMRQLRDRQIPSPDIPVVGFDNIMESLPMPLKFSSVGYATEDIALAASDLLLRMLRCETAPKQLVMNVRLYNYQ